MSPSIALGKYKQVGACVVNGNISGNYPQKHMLDFKWHFRSLERKHMLKKGNKVAERDLSSQAGLEDGLLD